MERVMAELIHYFAKQKVYELHLILYGINRDIFYTLPENIIIHKPKFAFKNSFRTWYTFKTLFFLRRKIKELKPYSILSFGELWNNFVLLAAQGLNYPIFVSDRCQPNKSLGRFHDPLRNYLYPKAAGVICQTETAKQLYSKMFKHKNLVVIGNPIRDIPNDKSDEKENVILSVGRLIKSKHHDELIRIFAAINPSNWKLIIVGDDALKQNNKVKLQELIIKLGMNDKIELAGQQSDVDTYFRRAKIFAFTSSSEGFPNVIGEAMSASLPVIAYDCVAGPSDLIDHEETGFLIDLHDTHSFKGQLKKLIDNEELRIRIGKSAKEKIGDFAVHKIANKFEKVLSN